ncbi:hypothetical protein HK405_000314, partial [Cladochytrium tenue]
FIRTPADETALLRALDKAMRTHAVLRARAPAVLAALLACGLLHIAPLQQWAASPAAAGGPAPDVATACAPALQPLCTAAATTESDDDDAAAAAAAAVGRERDFGAESTRAAAAVASH